MKPKTCLIALLGAVAGLGGGVLLDRQALSPPLSASPAPVADEPRILYWWDPMIPDFKSDKPGKSPMGMDMVPVHEGRAPGKAEPPGTVVVSPSVVHNLGVRTAVAGMKVLVPTVETFGSVTFDESRITHLHVRGSGWVDRLHARVLGETVEAGQVLMEIFSPDLIAASYEYVRETERGPSGNAEGARRKLLALGVADRQIEDIRRTRAVPGRVKVYAPQAGVIETLGVTEGMHVEPDRTLMSVVDHGQVWVIAELFESQAGLAFRGMAAEVRTTGLPGRVWVGAVDYVYPELKPDTRTVRLRIRLDNPDHALRHGMFASVRLAAAPRDAVLAIPADALIRTGRGDRVVLALGEGRFRPVPVKAGRVVGDLAEITGGLRDGDRVVTSAQFLIDSESSLGAGLARLPDAEPLPADPAPAPTLAPAPAVGEGEVAAVAGDGRRITLRHGPIPEMSWPAMTMEFGVGPGASVQGLAPGDRVRFRVLPAPDGGFTAAIVERLGAGGTP